MDPAFDQDIDDGLHDAEDPVLNNTDGVASREPRPSAKHDNSSPQRDQSSDGNGGALASVGDFYQIGVPPQTDDATNSSSADTAGRDEPHQPPPDNNTHNSSGGESPASFRSSVDVTNSVGQTSTYSDERLTKSPPRLLAGSVNGQEAESSPKDVAPTSESTAKYRDRNTSSAPSSPPGSPAAHGGSSSTTVEERSLESAEETQGSERGSGGPQADAGSGDLPTQLTRLWRTSPPPDRAEGLKAMRNMLKHRENLDAILSRLKAAKVRPRL